jgi:ABC-type transport system involved in multi-copper enzyme maturation permease subunit
MSAYPLPSTPRRTPHPAALWRPMAKATWLQHRGTIATGITLVALTALVIIMAGVDPHLEYARAAAAGCFGASPGAACPDLLNTLAGYTNGLSLITITLLVIPALAGMFIGAPLLAREVESGTFRFAWTQEIGRNRWLVGKLVLLGAASTLATAALGQLATWYASPFESAQLASHWQAGQFATTSCTLAAWTLFALAAGAFLGLVTGRAVAAMAATGALVGGLIVLNFMRLHDSLLSVAASVTQTSPSGTGLGALNTFPATGGIPGPPGSWLISGWYTGPGGHLLSGNALYSLLASLATSKSGAEQNPGQWLARHHYAYWVSYQPASRFWIFQGAETMLLLVFAALLTAGTIWLARRRHS